MVVSGTGQKIMSADIHGMTVSDAKRELEKLLKFIRAGECDIPADTSERCPAKWMGHKSSPSEKGELSRSD